MHAHISVIQLNVNHCAAAQTAAERNVDIMLLSEPYVIGTGQSSMILDESGRVAFKCCCPKVIAGDFNAWAAEWGSRASNTNTEL